MSDEPLAFQSWPGGPLVLTRPPAFPMQIIVPSGGGDLGILLHPDGTAEGDADALEGALRAMPGPSGPDTVWAWVILRALREQERPKPKRRRPA